MPERILSLEEKYCDAQHKALEQEAKATILEKELSAAKKEIERLSDIILTTSVRRLETINKLTELINQL